MKKLNFVYDKKSDDFLAPQFITNHVVAIRSYIAMKDNNDLIFNKFPEDFDLVTVEIGLSCDDNGVINGLVSGKSVVTPFVDIVGDVNG